MPSIINASTSGAGGVITTADASGVLQLQTGGTTAVTVDASQNVGIGTASPSSALEVARGAGGAAYLSLRGNNNSIANELIVGQGSDGSAFVYQRANSAIQFGTNNTTRMIIDANGLLQFNSGYGSAATAYGCRAWVNFNGTGTVAIRASGNVTSITDNGTGDYTLNFTTAMPDVNYAWSGNASGTGANSTGATIQEYQGGSRTTSTLRIYGIQINTPTDFPNIFISVIR
jgi:hypothetical protein